MRRRFSVEIVFMAVDSHCDGFYRGIVRNFAFGFEKTRMRRMSAKRRMSLDEMNILPKKRKMGRAV